MKYYSKFLCVLMSYISIVVSSWASVDYKSFLSSELGIESDSVNVQTDKIQKVIDKLSNEGGAKIIFSPGIYITGCIDLKSNIHIVLKRGAKILGSINPYDYKRKFIKNKPISPNANDNSELALFVANNVENISMSGEGVIDGRGRELALAVDSLHHKGISVDPKYNYDRNRPNETARPKLFCLSKVNGLRIQNLYLKNSACWGVTIELSCNIILDNLRVYNRAYWNNDGIDVTDCKNVRITRCDINTADDGICLKSYYPGYCNDSIYIADCRVCSSASAIKFGTASHGGFNNVEIDNIEIYDTYRSAIALETVDGGFLQNVKIVNINARNTGNAIFMRLGHRAGEKPGTLKNIYIGKMNVEVPFGRPDINYDLRGPSLPFFHNPIPSSIVGIPGNYIENVIIEDVVIRYPGRASKGMAYVPLWRLDSVPEEINSYPEFSMFGELPSWGFYVKHARNITFKNLTLKLSNDDFRPAFVFDDVENVKLEGLYLPIELNQIVIKNTKGMNIESRYNVLNY